MSTLLPDNAQTWVNQHLKFTHGAGLAMSPVNKKDTEGLPVFYIKDIPPNLGRRAARLTSRRIYFGEAPRQLRRRRFGDSRVRLSARAPTTSFRTTRASGGVPVSGLLRRLLFSIFFRDINLLVTENIVDEQQDHDSAQYHGPHRVHRAVPESAIAIPTW